MRHSGRAAIGPSRFAVAAIFFMHGILTGSWAPQIPVAKDRLEVGTGAFGWLLLALAAGGVVAMPVAGALINRFGSAAICRWSGVLMCFGFCLPVFAGAPLTLAVALAAFGAALGTLDVAMNAQGVAVERLSGRAVMSSFHGWFSVGAAVGAGAGGLVVGVLGAAAHAIGVVTVSVAILALASRRLLPTATDKGLSGAHFGWPTRATVGLGALAFLALLIEGAMLDWSALHLRQNAGASIALASLGFAAFSAGMAAARFGGDALRMRIGSVRLIGASATVLAASLAAGIFAGDPVPAVIAFTLAGLAVGNIAPILFAGGARVEPAAPGRGIAAVTTMGYSGFLLGPPLIGMAAEWTDLRTALALTVAAALVVAGFATVSRAADVRIDA